MSLEPVAFPQNTRASKQWCERRQLRTGVTCLELLVFQQFYNQPPDVLDRRFVVEKDEEVVEHHGLEVG